MGKSDQFHNKTWRLDELAKRLEFSLLKSSLGLDGWAFTRFDVVCHSQGGSIDPNALHSPTILQFWQRTFCE